MNMDPLPVRSFIDAFVVKNDNIYYMFVKNAEDAHVEWEDLSNAIWVYTSEDLTDWNKSYEIPGELLPLPFENGYKVYYEGPALIKNGDTWHFYADIMHWNLNPFKLTYPGQLKHLTSTDLKTWSDEGTVETYGEPLRHGSLTALTDNASVKVIQALYNK